jgi:hypothetical protein
MTKTNTNSDYLNFTQLTEVLTDNPKREKDTFKNEYVTMYLSWDIK